HSRLVSFGGGLYRHDGHRVAPWTPTRDYKTTRLRDYETARQWDNETTRPRSCSQWSVVTWSCLAEAPRSSLHAPYWYAPLHLVSCDRDRSGSLVSNTRAQCDRYSSMVRSVAGRCARLPGN